MPEISPSSRTGSSGGAALARASERATRGRAARRAGSSGSAESPLSDLEVVHRSVRRERQAVAERCDQEEAHGREEHERDERLGRRQNNRALQARAAVRGRPAPRGCVLAVAGRRGVATSLLFGKVRPDKCRCLFLGSRPWPSADVFFFGIGPAGPSADFFFLEDGQGERVAGHAQGSIRNGLK